MVNEEILNELKKISKTLLLVCGDQLERELGRLATSDDRKRVWILIDGKLTAKEIANKLNLTLRAVHIFLATLEKAGLIENPWGKPPKRIIDYVPPKWIELLKFPAVEEKRDIES